MDFQKLNEIAMKDARNILIKGFNWEAFLVYSIAMQNMQNVPDIEDTEIDDNIKAVFTDFVQYYNKKQSGHDASKEFSSMLTAFRKIITELYYQSDDKEKEMIKSTLEKMQKI